MFEIEVRIVKMLQFVWNVRSSPYQVVMSKMLEIQQQQYKVEKQKSESSCCWIMSTLTTNLSAKSQIEQIAVLHQKVKCLLKENKKNV